MRPGGALRTETNLILVHLLVAALYKVLICENILEFFPIKILNHGRLATVSNYKKSPTMHYTKLSYECESIKVYAQQCMSNPLPAGTWQWIIPILKYQMWITHCYIFCIVDINIKMNLSTASNSFEKTTKKPIYALRGEELFFFLHNVTNVEQIIFPEGEDFDYRDCQTR